MRWSTGVVVEDSQVCSMFTNMWLLKIGSYLWNHYYSSNVLWALSPPLSWVTVTVTVTAWFHDKSILNTSYNHIWCDLSNQMWRRDCRIVIQLSDHASLKQFHTASWCWSWSPDSRLFDPATLSCFTKTIPCSVVMLLIVPRSVYQYTVQGIIAADGRLKSWCTLFCAEGLQWDSWVIFIPRHGLLLSGTNMLNTEAELKSSRHAHGNYGCSLFFKKKEVGSPLNHYSLLLKENPSPLFIKIKTLQHYGRQNLFTTLIPFSFTKRNNLHFIINSISNKCTCKHRSKLFDVIATRYNLYLWWRTEQE
jgi:hypothetical protein